MRLRQSSRAILAVGVVGMLILGAMSASASGGGRGASGARALPPRVQGTDGRVALSPTVDYALRHAFDGIGSAGGEADGGIAQAEAWFIHQRAYPLSHIPVGARLRALAQTTALRRAVLANHANHANTVNATGPGGAWQHVGPNGQDDPPNSFGFGYGHESGRDTSIVISPADPNTIFVGTAGGGVWKSADGGTSWATTTDNQASLAIGAMAIAPTTPYTVYALTGEGNFSGDSYYGAGLLRSADGGASWTLTGTSLSRLSANKLAVDPTSPAILYAALTNGGRAQFPEGKGATTATGGIYRSLDGGATWALSLNPGSSADSPCASTNVMSGTDTQTYDSGEAGTDIAVGVDPTTPTTTTVYAALGAPGGCPNNGIYKSVDHGQTWTALTAFTQTVPVADQGKIGRISLSTMPGKPQVVYASASITGANGNSTYLEGVYESTNGGTTWTQVTNPDPSSGSKPGTQYDYDTYIAVDPLVSSTVFVAGTDVFKSTNSSGTWTNVTNAYGSGAGIVHGDQHALAFVPRTDSATTPTIFLGNDGGLYRSTDGGTSWSNSDSGASGANNGIEARQIYHSAVSAAGQPTQYYIGLQDNNVSHYTGMGQWLPVSTGDGMNAAVALTNSNIAYNRGPERSNLADDRWRTTLQHYV